MKWILSLSAIALGFALGGCAIVVPVHEAQPPENLDNWGFRFGIITGAAPQVAPPDTGITADRSATTMSVFGYRLGFGFLERFQINAEAFVTGTVGGNTSLALKYQWTGDTYFKSKAHNSSQVSTLRVWDGFAPDLKLQTNGQTTYEHSNLTGQGYDLSHLWGYRFADAFGVYGGPKVIVGKVHAEYRDVKDGPVVGTAARSVFGGGALGGLFISPHSSHIGFDLGLEVELMNLPATYTTERAWYTSFMLSAAIPFSFAGGGS